MFSSNTTQVSSGAYEISRSLRFNDADSAYLNRTFTSASNQKTWTWSGWVKRTGPTNPTNAVLPFFGVTNAGNDSGFFVVGALGDVISIQGWNTVHLRTTAVYRDYSAWQHIVVALDTTQSTAANRLKLYVNGVQETAFSFNTPPTLNADYPINGNVAHNIFSETGVGSYELGGYLTEVNFIDGQALTPSSFGETNAQTGVWQPKAYSGSYGTNGFYLNFSDNSNTTAATLGKDYSGNGNNWTPNNFSVTAGVGNDSMVDSPTAYGFDTGVGGTVRGNYATLNPLKKGTSVSLANGNLDFASSDAGGSNVCLATMGMSSGKWYWEVTPTSTAIGAGIATDAVSLNIYLGQDAFGWMYYNNGFKYNNASGSSYGASYASGDVIGFAFDADAGSITCYKNGTSQGVMYSGLAAGTYFPAVSDADASTCTATANFGQRPFAYTAPSGFKALCTQNLPVPSIGATTATQASKYFGITLRNGTGTSGGTFSTTVNMANGAMLWDKERNTAGAHYLFDSVRGISKSLSSNTSGTEQTFPTWYTNFGTDTYTVGSSDWGTGSTVVDWIWAANGSGSTNTAGSITSTVSANTTSGFSVVTYTGTGANATVGHGLGVAPSMVITKSRSDTGGWAVYHISTGASYYLLLNGTSTAANEPTLWNNTAPTSTRFSIGTSGAANTSAATYVAYCFAEVAGYSKIGSYTGNGSADGPFVFTGMRPAYLLVKNATSSGDWIVVDAKRNTYNMMDSGLQPNGAYAEASNQNYRFDFLSNGFKVRTTNLEANQSGNTIIFMAFAEAPQKFSLAR